ncbi:MAG: glycoside hydrolase family 57 [Alphaproteobacteria bacterium]|nr:glycoside hydrolase family 57 [Alphaproteobacteria bacterium]
MQPVLYTVFHLNLAFSSIEEEDRLAVIENCYWPLLRLARDGIPVGIEATSYTLREIEKYSPKWISEIKELLSEGLVEFVASGFCQIIAPLTPPQVTEKNLRLGLEDYQSILGVRPNIALINEQAYSRGILGLYKEAGFGAVIMDWAEPASHNKSWKKAYIDRPQIVEGQGGVTLPVLWSDAITFQKFQRYAHGELSAAEYFDFLSEQMARGAEAIPIYTSDAEVFDFRPGRFQAEAVLGSHFEFDRIGLLLSSLQNSDEVQLGLPSEALRLVDRSSPPLHMETSQVPVPVKKQRKYNVTRWGLTGRHDLALNTHCWRQFDHLMHDPNQGDEDWRDLCYLWSSDFRTHLTEKRWNLLTDKVGLAPFSDVSPRETDEALPDDVKVARDGRFLSIEAKGVHLVLNARKGLCIQSFGYGTCELAMSGKLDPGSVIGTLGHGYFEDIEFGADFFSGHWVYEPSSSHKVTDLVSCEPTVRWCGKKSEIVISAALQIGHGEVIKEIGFCPERSSVSISYKGNTGLLCGHAEGSSRLGYITLNPGFFDEESLYYGSHNGGHDLEVFQLFGGGAIAEIDHGKPVSRLVTASTAVGMTQGILVLGDRKNLVGIEMKRTDCAGLGMVKCTKADDKMFVRACVSVGEQDETRKPAEVKSAVIAGGVDPVLRIFLGKTPNLLE